MNADNLDEKQREKALKRAPEQKKAFYQRIADELPRNDRTSAILRFLDTVNPHRLSEESVWIEIQAANPVLSFRFHDEQQLYCSTAAVASVISDAENDKNPDGVCLVTGRQDRIATLHTSIKGVNGAQSSGANIVSFNLDPFRSFNKNQGKNAPVGKRAMFAYTTALNTLLAKESLQKIQVGDASTIFWSQKKTRFESDFSFFFTEPEKDDPSAHIDRIKNLFNSVQSGAYRDDTGEERFFVLGLAPNAARISIRFWQVGTVSEFASRIKQHFKDLQITKPPREPEFYSLWRLLVNIATLDKSENIPPNTASNRYERP